MAKHGILLSDAARNAGPLSALLRLFDPLASAAWVEVRPESGARGVLLESAALTAARARALSAEGVPVVLLTAAGDGVAWEPLAPGPGRTAGSWPRVTRRRAATLAEALRPRPLAGLPPIDEVLVTLPREGATLHQVMTLLVSQGRREAALLYPTGEGWGRSMALRLDEPPRYLLLRAQEKPEEGLAAYVRVAEGGLWVAFGFAHPIGEALSAALAARKEWVLVGADGVWRRLDPATPARPWDEALSPPAGAFDGSPSWSAAPPGKAFLVKAALGPATVRLDPTLWVLSPTHLEALMESVEGMTPEDLDGFTLAQAEGADGATRYILQETPRKRGAPLGVRLSEVLGVQGYAPAPGNESLFLPVGRQIVPPLRRDVVRDALGIDRAPLSVLMEGPRGVLTLALIHAPSKPLRQWVDYAVSDRQVVLEAPAERSLFGLDSYRVEAPPAPRARRAQTQEEEDDAFEASRPPRAPRAPQAPQPTRTTAPVAQAPDRRAEALRAQARPLEAALARGGGNDPAPWRALAEIKVALGEGDEAALCLEAALCFGGADRATAETLLGLRTAALRGASGPGEAARLVASTDLSAREAAWLGAWTVASIARGDRLDAAFLSEVTTRFCEAVTPVSRWLAWSVVLAAQSVSRDVLGLTRAKERLLGGLSEKGLSTLLDTPRFIRVTLVDGDTGEQARTCADHFRVLDELWNTESAALGGPETPLGGYARVIFAYGFLRLGATEKALELRGQVERVLRGHNAPNQGIFALYMKRMEFERDMADTAPWVAAVQVVRDSFTDSRVRDRFTFLQQRSDWLKLPPPAKPDSQLSGTIMAAVAEAEAEADSPRLAQRFKDILKMRPDKRELFDYEVVQIIERLQGAGREAGNEAALPEMLAVSLAAVTTHLQAPARRVNVLGVCLKTAALLGDLPTLDRLLADIVTQSKAIGNPSQLLRGVSPALAALRRLGAGESARRFLDSLLPLTAVEPNKTPPRGFLELQTILAQGYLLLRDEARATSLLEGAVQLTLADVVQNVDRLDAAKAAFEALAHWPLGVRFDLARRFLGRLGKFTDAFTASQAGIYEIHKVLVLELIVDMIADASTFEHDRVRGYLDEEENALRRRILDDWRGFSARGGAPAPPRANPGRTPRTGGILGFLRGGR